jgi:hypothetical protein
MRTYGTRRGQGVFGARWIRIAILAGAFSCGLAGQGAGGCVPQLRFTGGFVLREVYQCPPSMPVEELRGACQSLLGRRKAEGKRGFTEVIVGTSLGELYRSVLRRNWGNHSQGAGFDQILYTLRETEREFRLPHGEVEGVMARCIAFRGGRSTTVVSGSAENSGSVVVEKSIAEGRDPQAMDVGGQRLELLWVRENDVSPFVNSDSLDVSAYSADRFGCDTCRAGLAEIEGSTGRGYDRLQLTIRNSYWFDGEAFPLVYRFGSGKDRGFIGKGPYPAVETLYRSVSEVVCWRTKRNEPVSCAYSGSWPEERVQELMERER